MRYRNQKLSTGGGAHLSLRLPEIGGELMKFVHFVALTPCLLLALAGCDKLSDLSGNGAGTTGLAAVRAAIVARNFGEAVDLAAAEVKAHPNDAAAHFEQARAEALAGNEGRALDALDKAITLGLADPARALDDAAFSQISDSERFAGLISRANPAAGGEQAGMIVAGTPGVRGSDDGVAIREKAGGGTRIQAGDVVLDTDF